MFADRAMAFALTHLDILLRSYYNDAAGHPLRSGCGCFGHDGPCLRRTAVRRFYHLTRLVARLPLPGWPYLPTGFGRRSLKRRVDAPGRWLGVITGCISFNA